MSSISSKYIQQQTGKRPPSNAGRGAYYVRRTIEWLRAEGYLAEKIERQARTVVHRTRVDPVTRKRTTTPEVIFSKRDLWGGDVVARNADRLLWVQVKSRSADVSAGMRELSQGPWPASIGRWVVWWPRGRRLAVGPEIQVVE